MALEDLADEKGNWKKEKVIGCGGFGYVVLWRNKISNDMIALKECRWGHDPMMTPKHRSRWKMEVDMMSRLCHPNVVKAIPVPPELDVPSTEMPLLAMEYCTNGDLRKVLNRPENCCGLKEKHVRLIMKHISSAVNYLHSMRIIHRDLKPENIVIQDLNGNVVYKLIDLGYAKELDQGSLCTSFVGTLQYLAPELFMSQKYSSTVDYWSLGLVAHEIITGSRPFLPDKSPAEWIPAIKRKNSKDIRAFLDADKNIMFSEEIAPFHYISNTLKKDLELWLQLMLEWDPKKRGKCETSTFNLLDSILAKKVVHIFWADTLLFLSIPVSEEMSLEEFFKEVESRTNLPVDQMEILFADGRTTNHELGVSQFVSNLETEERLIFLFDKNGSFQNVSPSSTTVIPPGVESMMRNPHLEVEYYSQRATWAQAVFLCQQEYILVSRLIRAFKSNLIHLLTKTSYTHKSVSRMAAEMNKLLTKCTFFKNSIEQDLQCYEKQVETGGFTSDSLHADWQTTYENLQKVDILRQKVVNLEACSSNINFHTADLQKSPYARSKFSSPLEDTFQKVLDLYAEIRKRTSEERKTQRNNTDIVRQLCVCLQQSHTLIQDLVATQRKVRQAKKDVDECLPQIINLLQEIADWDSQIDAWQAKRQRTMWKVVDNLVDKVRQAERSSSPLVISGSPQATLLRRTSGGSQGYPPLSRVSIDYGSRQSLESPKPFSLLRTPPIIAPSSLLNQLDSFSLSSSPQNDENSLHRLHRSSLPSNGVSLSAFLDKTSQETRRIKEENENLVESFQTMMETLKSFKVEDGVNGNGKETIYDKNLG